MTTSSSRQRRSSFGLLRRDEEGALLGGVCAGLSRAFAVDPTLLRLAFVTLALAWGTGALLYALLWLCLPPLGARGVWSLRRSVRENARRFGRSLSRSGRTLHESWERAGVGQTWPRPLSRRWIAVGLAAGGAFVLLASFGAFDWLDPTRALGLAAIAVGFGMILSLK